MWSYCLYGMLIVQVCKWQSRYSELILIFSGDFYSEMFPKDGRGIKALGEFLCCRIEFPLDSPHSRVNVPPGDGLHLVHDYRGMEWLRARVG